MVDVTELGRKGGPATAANRTAKERKAASVVAITARWAAYYELHPEKLEAKLERDAKRAASLRKKQKAAK